MSVTLYYSSKVNLTDEILDLIRKDMELYWERISQGHYWWSEPMNLIEITNESLLGVSRLGASNYVKYI